MNLTDDASSDLFNLVCGEMIGEGQYRRVYKHWQDEAKVVKFDTGVNYSNINEFQIWSEFKGTALEKWLAPCDWLSPRGLWLIQAKTTPIDKSKLPKRVPALFADMKSENWGMYNGHPVCHDYGNHSLFKISRKTATLLSPAKWYK